MLGKFLIHFVLAATMLAGTAAADDESDCFSSESPTRIDACTRLISMPGQQKEALASAHHQRGLAYLAAGQDARSKLDFDRALVLAPDNPSVLTDRGVARCRLGDYKQANVDFANAIKAGPTFETAYFNRAVCYLRQNQFNNAIKDFQKVTEFSRQDADAYYGQFLAYTKKKDTKQAINSHYVAMHLDPAVANRTIEFRSSELEPTSGGGGKKKKGKRAKKKAAKCPGYAPWDPDKKQCVDDKTKRAVTVHELSIYYGTDRMPKTDGERLSYGKEKAGALTLGRADVSVPIYRRVGEIERPWSLTSEALHIMGSAENPAKYYVIQKVSKLEKAEFVSGVADTLQGSTDYKGQAFVFVHGYNVSFDDALYRAAQIAADSGFDGVPFVYSWPSAGELLPYEDDRKSAEQAVPYLRAFLESVVNETGVEKVHLIAHSMGSVVLLNALKGLAQVDPFPGKAKFGEIVLAAPDVDTQRFQEIASSIANFGAGKTLYASSEDLALKASILGWGGSRAGNVPTGGPLVLPGVDTIDVSAVNTDILGHSTYAAEMKLLIDIGLLLKGLHPPRSRVPLLFPGNASGGTYWIWPE